MLREQLALVTRLVEKLTREQPRNLDIHHLAYETRRLACAAAEDVSTARVGKRKRRRRDWAAIKRRQRARARGALAQAGAGNPGGEAALTPEQVDADRGS
jgi:hypothetical protein